MFVGIMEGVQILMNRYLAPAPVVFTPTRGCADVIRRQSIRLYGMYKITIIPSSHVCPGFLGLYSIVRNWTIDRLTSDSQSLHL